MVHHQPVSQSSAHPAVWVKVDAYSQMTLFAVALESRVNTLIVATLIWNSRFNYRDFCDRIIKARLCGMMMIKRPHVSGRALKREGV